MIKYTFSGHESFLKKGYEFVNSGYSFNDEHAIVQLGVGKNMVGSIKYWMRAFGLIADDNQLTPIAHYIFNEKNGKDPYLEDILTVWILHYYLVKSRCATLYYEFFYNFQRGILEFNKPELLEYIKRQFSLGKFGTTLLNENTIKKDIDVFLKNYIRPKNKNKNEDAFTLLSRLKLLYAGENEMSVVRRDLLYFPPLVLFFAIQDNVVDEIADYELIKTLGRIFCLTEDNIIECLDTLSSLNIGLTYKNTAGEQLVVLKRTDNAFAILDQYYSE